MRARASPPSTCCGWTAAPGEAALYKYGAAPSYLKKLGRVTRYGGAALPAGLEGADRQPDVIRFVLPPDGWLVMVSDGVVGGDGDEWLQDLLAGWGGGTPDAWPPHPHHVRRTRRAVR